ncbi:hypothetical protein DEJ31_02835 [Curtobacterium sp. MCPF17_031]|nr:hypothetical protein DEJ31_02835 [Curtobacterium sp. MCPF17_031]
MQATIPAPGPGQPGPGRLGPGQPGPGQPGPGRPAVSSCRGTPRRTRRGVVRGRPAAPGSR